jgi:hypothetical protein
MIWKGGERSMQCGGNGRIRNSPYHIQSPDIHAPQEQVNRT